MMFQDLIEEYQINQAKLPTFLQDKIVWFHSLSIQVKQSASVVEKKESKPTKVDWSKLTAAKMGVLEKDLRKSWKHTGETITTRDFLNQGLLMYKTISRGTHFLCFQQFKGIKVSKSLYERVDLPTSWEERGGVEEAAPGGVDAQLEALLQEADKALCVALLVYLKENPAAIDELVGQEDAAPTVYNGYYDSLLGLCSELPNILLPGKSRVFAFTGFSDVNPNWRVELKYFSEYQTEGCVYAVLTLFIDDELNMQVVLIICSDTVEPVISRSVEHGKMDVVQKYNPYDDGKLLRENTQLINSRFEILLGDLQIENLRFASEQISLSGVIQQMLVELT